MHSCPLYLGPVNILSFKICGLVVLTLKGRVLKLITKSPLDPLSDFLPPAKVELNRTVLFRTHILNI